MEEGEVAESKRRGEDAVDEHLDEVFVDAVDDDAPDEFDDDADSALDDEGTDKSVRGSSSKPPTGTKGLKSEDASPGSSSGRITRFLREVVAELRKVNWPSRHELITYTTVVVLFVVVMMSIVAGLDWGFGWLVTHVFG